MKSIIFVDDGITGHKSLSLAKIAANIVRCDLTSAGFVINIEKSNFNPTRLGTWFGTIINTEAMTFSVPKKKINKLLSFINQVLSQRFTSAK